MNLERAIRINNTRLLYAAYGEEVISLKEFLDEVSVDEMIEAKEIVSGLLSVVSGQKGSTGRCHYGAAKEIEGLKIFSKKESEEFREKYGFLSKAACN